MYSATTHSIRVTVNPIYLEDQSEPEEDHYVWAYQVEIENLGADVVQLLSRYWHITDSQGRIQEVRGVGVVGEQPVLNPGESFNYTSGTPLPRRPASCREATAWSAPRASGSRSRFRLFRSTARISQSD